MLVGPTAKVDPARLPAGRNLHYLGPQSPTPSCRDYIAGWDVAMLPFARNDATRFISPTKTPEYLAAGKPVVSTSIRDVVRPYGQQRPRPHCRLSVDDVHRRGRRGALRRSGRQRLRAATRS